MLSTESNTRALRHGDFNVGCRTAAPALLFPVPKTHPKSVSNLHPSLKQLGFVKDERKRATAVEELRAEYEALAGICIKVQTGYSDNGSNEHRSDTNVHRRLAQQGQRSGGAFHLEF
ncbi:hypothetical protein BGZ82_008224 [Podila clonocystis]|nr:hypothetical protein BGZ82_008224 [Podila clonocystis]